MSSAEIAHLYSPGNHREPAMFVRDLAQQFVDDLALRVQAGQYSAEALANIRRDLLGGKSGKPVALVAFAGQIPADELSLPVLQRWLLANPQWQSVHKQKGAVNAVKAMYTWAWRAFALPCPVRAWPSVLSVPGEPRREASPAEYIRLMRGGSRVLRRGLYFLWNTGCRPAEMRQLTWPMVLFDEHVVELPRKHNKTGRVTGKPRVFGLEKRLVRFLTNLHRQRPPFQEHVFTNSDGTPWDRHTWARHLRRTARRLGLDDGVEKRLSSYCLRHTYITEADLAGVNDRHIAYQSGHANTKMIDWYSKARKSRRQARGSGNEIAKARRRLRKQPQQLFDGLE